MQYWLVKSEPDAFSIDDLANSPRKTTYWDGVRNYQARNMMRDEMKRGDKVFYYHSNCDEPGIVGIAAVARKGYPDHSAFDKKHKYYDAKSDPSNPRWYMVDVRLVRKFARNVPLSELRQYSDSALADMRLLQKGNRLSVMPIAKEHWDFVLTLADT